MADTSTKQGAAVRTPATAEVAPAPKETRRPPRERPRRFVRWIEYAAIVLLLGAAAVIAVLMLRGGGEEVAYETVDRHELAELAKLRVGVEAGSGLSLGERHTNPDFAVDQRWVGESGATLEEVEAGALVIVPVTPVSYESNVALREAGALVVVPVAPVSYESNVALREAGALAALPIIPVSYESHAALREAGGPFGASLDTFETTYEAESGLSMGARHTDSELDIGVRFVGESDMTLEEFELSE